MKKIVLLFSAILIAFGTMAQEEQVTQEDLEQWTMDAEQGYAQAQYNLGVCYENGYGVKKDLNKAKYYYDKARENK